MKIVKLQVENFRSIDNLVLDDLESLNVFIGKNNSGKSTILTSFEMFFKMLTPGLVTNIFNARDFHHSDPSKSIKMVGTFLLQEEVFQILIDQMKEENPQILSAIESLRNMPFVNIHTSSLISGKSVMSYISKISLSFDATQQNEKVLFNIGEAVASELISRYFKNKSLHEKINELNESTKYVDPDEFRLMKERGRVRFRSSEIISDLMLSSADFQEFRNNVRSEIEKSNRELSHILNMETQNEFTVLAGVTKLVPQHINRLLDGFSKINILREYERKNPIGKEDATRLLDLKVTRGGPERFDQLRQIVENLLGVKLEAFKSSDASANAEIDIDNFLIDMNGAGIRESLRLILDIEFNSPNIVLLEEPEVHLHFGLEKKMFRYLAQLAGGIQIFLTTHSTGFVDTSGTNNVYLVKKDLNTRATRLNNNELTDILSELDINISSLLLAKILVFVEGPTDEYIARSYFDMNHPEISYSDIGFIRMKGIGNYKYYANAHALEAFSQRGLKTFFIVDMDNNDAAAIERIKVQHPDYSFIEVLSKRCIENFFIDPNVIREFLKRKSNLTGTLINLPDKENFEKLILEKAEGLFSETIRLYLSWKYLKPIYPTSISSSKQQISTVDQVVEWVSEKIRLIDETNNKVKELFEKEYKDDIESLSERWKTEKMSMVPGDKLLDAVCSEYGLRYNKTQIDSDLLCQSLGRKNWPAELVAVFEKIIKITSDTGNSIFEA